ncbi:MAG: HEPN domain-containing protein [Fusobacteriota bacterium]
MKFEKNYEILLKKANTDLKSAEILYSTDNEEIDVEVILFHLQQAAEKYLKSLISYNGIHFSRTHDLVQLLEDNSNELLNLKVDQDLLLELNQYAVTGRYNYISEIVENIDDYFNCVIVIKEIIMEIIEE